MTGKWTAHADKSFKGLYQKYKDFWEYLEIFQLPRSEEVTKELKLLANYIDRLEESITKINGRLDIIEEKIKLEHEYTQKVTDKIWQKISLMAEMVLKIKEKLKK